MKAKKKKLSFKEQKEYDSLESEIEKLEERKAELEALINSGENDHEKLQAWSEEISQIIAKIDEKSERWLELAEYA